MAQMNFEILGISLYVLAMLVMGHVVSKSIKTDDDYFLAGRSLGPFLATFSIFATWFGAETCVGTSGAVYRNGLGSIHADPLGYGICILLMGILFSKILWQKKITTIPDLFRQRFSPRVEKLTALIIIPSSIIWASAQIRAFGQILHSTTDFAVGPAITLAAVVVIIYTVFGGLLADAYTDLIQGFALIIGLVFLVFFMISDLGGITQAFSTIHISKLSWMNPEAQGLTFLGRAELWLVPILGSLMSQELVSRVVASRSQDVAFNSSLRAAILYLGIGFLPVMVGLLGSNYLPRLEEAETIMPVLAKMHLNYFFYIIFIGALVSAILSTVDSTLLAASALLSHNLIYPVTSNLSERKKLIIARGGVILSGVISYVIAFMSDSIMELVETASSLGGPSILVLSLIALYVKKGNALNAHIAVGSSVITWVLGHFVWQVEYPVILTVVSCLCFYFISLPLNHILPKGENLGPLRLEK
jgi:SSS family solute:Na+ symporter